MLLLGWLNNNNDYNKNYNNNNVSYQLISLLVAETNLLSLVSISYLMLRTIL